MQKKIEVLHLKPSELNTTFQNPRKITNEAMEKLKSSIEKYGDHDCIKIDEAHNIISGNQRVKAMIELGIDTPILCKKLIGYSEKELKAINIKSNEHYGEWDYDLLSEWQNDIKDLDLEINVPIIEFDDLGVTGFQDRQFTNKKVPLQIGKLFYLVESEILERMFFINIKKITNEHKIIIQKKIEELEDEILFN